MKLHDVQVEALARSNRAGGFAYFMEQGLGKTMTVLEEFRRMTVDRVATRLVVICPNSFKGGWKAEAEKQGYDFDFFIWEAGMDSYLARWSKTKFKKPPVLVINYESIRATKVQRGKNHIWLEGKLAKLIEDFIAPANAYIAFDESIKLKTHNSATTIGAIRISDRFQFSRVLSGKPTSQGPHDLWGQLRVIGKTGGRDFHPFKTAFCKMGGFQMKVVMGAQNEDILAEIIDPHIFRATKLDWTDLPPKIYTERDYRMTPEMAAMYKSMETEFVLWLSEEEAVSVDQAITKYIKLAQIQCGWIYDEQRKVRWLVEDKKNPRLNLLEELLEEEVPGKANIVYHHRPVFDQLMQRFAHLNPSFIRGGMKTEEIEEQKTKFNTDPTSRIILLQDDASKYGHTLLGGPEPKNRCSTTLFYENNYNLDTRSQIEDRNHRHGQTAESVLYLDLVGTPLDRDCVRALQRKEDIFQAVFARFRRSSVSTEK